MSDKNFKRIDPLFVLVVGGDATFTSCNKDVVIEGAREEVMQNISDHRRHNLPLKLTEKDIRWIDVEVHELSGDKSQLDIPYQTWVDEMWREWQESDREDEDREYLQFKELREKWEERFQSEQQDEIHDAILEAELDASGE